ncbi:hypothetical protein SS50377_22936 [Spironucleus salmonicida]|uniref:Uncharacterized protein n=1 Tax=Spironucleus salmonicida TaxID=348837 RepID=A0A9P8LWH5_9EUKA|nr:hypothetical protein SS50377_22931 [Spironucleus salmonicida]KAH0575308.1 hypothetical protein SS50377_22936 [Spironucleus salmonicida]
MTKASMASVELPVKLRFTPMPHATVRFSPLITPQMQYRLFYPRQRGPGSIKQRWLNFQTAILDNLLACGGTRKPETGVNHH